MPLLFTAGEAVLARVPDLVALVSGARRASLLLLGEDRQLWLACAVGLPVPSGQPVVLAPGVAAEALRTGVPIMSEDLTRTAFPAHPERGYTTTSCLAVPVFWQGTLYGVICAADPERAPAFTAHDLHGVRLLAEHLGACIHAAASAGALSETDSLTGVQTRGAFERRLGVEVERSRRFGHPLSLLMLDIDNLKRINDVEGHRVGDRVLSQTAHTLLETVRSVDLVARYGGDEFSILLPETGASDSLKVAQRVAMSLHRISLPGNGRLVAPLRAALGAATLPPASDVGELLDQASHALHLAKGDRERVRHWSQENGAGNSRSYACSCAFCARTFLVDTAGRQRTRRYCSRRCSEAARRLAKGDRNAAIVSLRASGLTLQAISIRYGLSMERVRQICKSR